MDDQHNYPTDDADEPRLILLQLDEAGRQEVYALIRELAAESDKLEQATTVAELFQLWRNVRERAEAASDDTIADCMAQRAFLIEQRAVALPVTSARDVLAPIVMTTEAGNELARTSQDALVASAYTEMDANYTKPASALLRRRAGSGKSRPVLTHFPSIAPRCAGGRSKGGASENGPSHSSSRITPTQFSFFIFSRADPSPIFRLRRIPQEK